MTLANGKQRKKPLLTPQKTRLGLQDFDACIQLFSVGIKTRLWMINAFMDPVEMNQYLFQEMKDYLQSIPQGRRTRIYQHELTVLRQVAGAARAHYAAHLRKHIEKYYQLPQNIEDRKIRIAQLLNQDHFLYQSADDPTQFDKFEKPLRSLSFVYPIDDYILAPATARFVGLGKADFTKTIPLPALALTASVIKASLECYSNPTGQFIAKTYSTGNYSADYKRLFEKIQTFMKEDPEIEEFYQKISTNPPEGEVVAVEKSKKRGRPKKVAIGRGNGENINPFTTQK